MTTGRPTAAAPDFDQLIAEVLLGSGRFGHREHVHLTWLAVRHFGPARAVGVISDGIQRTARHRSTTLAGHRARVGWVEPDAHAFPWA
jgi:hypothetical protein